MPARTGLVWAPVLCALVLSVVVLCVDAQYEVVDVLRADGTVQTAVAVDQTDPENLATHLSCPPFPPTPLSTSPDAALLALFPRCASALCAVGWAPTQDVQACSLPSPGGSPGPPDTPDTPPTPLDGLEGLEWVLNSVPPSFNVSRLASAVSQLSANDSALIRRHTQHRSVHRHVQTFANMFLETQSKVAGLLHAGVRAKEVFALIVDQIMNMAPEIILQILISVLRGVFIELMGKLLSVLLPPLLIPNDGSTPPTLPGLPVPVPKPPAPCRCRDKLGVEYTPKFSMLQEWARAAHAGAGLSHRTDAARHREAMRVLCPCKPGHSMVLLEERASAQSRGPPLESERPVLERIEEKAGDAIREGLEAEALPGTYSRVLTRLTKTLTTVTPQSVVRGVNRALTTALAHSLTTSVSRSLLASLSRSSLKSCTRAVSAKLIPALTVSLSSSLAQTMSRDPRSDYFCDYCTRFKTYCGECHAATAAAHHLDVTVAKYARHFGGHSAKLYAGDLADDISGLVLGE